MVIDTACSSTLTALNQAVNGLKSGESEMALVCGANLILNPDMVSTNEIDRDGFCVLKYIIYLTRHTDLNCSG